MKNILIAALFFASQVYAADAVIPNNKLKVGQATSSADKVLEFNTNQGANNPKIKVNPSTNKIQFSNDGTNFKDIGSVSGSGVGINLLASPGFETGIADGWISSGGTFAAVTSGSNLLYQTTSASFLASASGQYFESTAIAIPEILKGQDCMVKIAYKGADANGYLTVLDSSNVELITTSARAVLNSSSGLKVAKTYFTCPSTGSMKLRVQSTAAMAVGYFDEGSLGSADFLPVKQAQFLGDVTFTGSGAYNLVGTALQDVQMTNGAVPRTYTGSLTAPTGNRVGFTLTSLQPGRYVVKGVGIQATASTFATSNNSPYVNFSSNDFTYCGSMKGPGNIANSMDSITSADFTCEFNVTSQVASKEVWIQTYANTSAAQYISVNASGNNNTTKITVYFFPTGNDTVVNSKCQNDIACENVFSAKVSVAGVVSDENLDWISGNCSGSTPYTCTFNASIFTVAPNCTVTNSGGAQHFSALGSVTASSLVVNTFLDNGTATSQQFHIKCQKAGVDFKAKQAITGFMASTVTSTNNFTRVESVMFGGSGSSGSGCTASPCTIWSNSGAASTVTRTGTGAYTVAFPVGTFSGLPACTCSLNGGGTIYCTAIITSTTSIGITAFNSSGGAASDIAANLICVGPR